MDSKDIENLKEMLAKVDAEMSSLSKRREMLASLLNDFGENVPAADRLISSAKSLQSKTSNTVGGRVIDAVVELIHSMGRQVSKTEIFDYCEQKRLSLGNTDNKSGNLGAILSNEAKKPNARIKRVEQGKYDVR